MQRVVALELWVSCGECDDRSDECVAEDVEHGELGGACHEGGIEDAHVRGFRERDEVLRFFLLAARSFASLSR